MIEIDKFIEEFNPTECGFYDPVKFIDGFGFSVKKDFGKIKDNKTTLISVYIPDYIRNNKEDKKSLSISATYGEITRDGIRIRSSRKFNEPQDLWFSEEYFFSESQNKFYKKNKLIQPEQILNDVYNKHTRIHLTFPLALKENFFIRVRNFEFLLYKLSLRLLNSITGNKYEVDDKRSFTNPVELTFKPGAEKKQLDFFGYKTTKGAIAVYSLAHILLFTIFYLCSYYPKYLVLIYKNNFLTVVYAVVTLGLFEKISPKILEHFTKLFYKLSYGIPLYNADVEWRG